jgi:hypothetical protein
MCLQVRGNRFTRFAMFHGGNEFPIQELKDVLKLSRFESTKDSHENNFTMLTTCKPMRVSQIQYDLNEFN